MLAFSEAPTPDDVVRIEVRDADNIYLQGVLDGQDDPQWWLEASSYPISIVDTERVAGAHHQPRARREVRRGAGGGVVPLGRGRRVPHDLALLPAAHRAAHGAAPAAAADAYFAEKGVAMTMAMRDDYADLSLADVESAKPSAAFMSNVIIEKKRRQKKGAP